MKKILSLRFAVSLFVLLMSIGLFCPQSANAQDPPGLVVPKPLYRFIVPGATYGFFITPNYDEGVSRGYYYNATIGGIVIPPGPGWTPAPGQGLVPMHRWRVQHRAGTNYAFSADFYPSITSNPENTYDGMIGYGLLPSEQWGGASAFVLHLWYSTTNGYYYDSNGSMTTPPPPPNYSYNWQGVAYRLPAPAPPFGAMCGVNVVCYTFNPPPPAPSCDANQEQSCYANGGIWNSDNCTCSYPAPDPEPDPEPCRPGMICQAQPY